MNDYAQIYASVYGINIENAKMAVLSGKYGSTYTNGDNTSSNVYLDKGNNQNALDTANTLGHEVAHVRQNQGQDISKRYFTTARRVCKLVWKLFFKWIRLFIICI